MAEEIWGLARAGETSAAAHEWVRAPGGESPLSDTEELAARVSAERAGRNVGGIGGSSTLAGGRTQAGITAGHCRKRHGHRARAIEGCSEITAAVEIHTWRVQRGTRVGRSGGRDRLSLGRDITGSRIREVGEAMGHTELVRPAGHGVGEASHISRQRACRRGAGLLLGAELRLCLRLGGSLRRGMGHRMDQRESFRRIRLSSRRRRR